MNSAALGIICISRSRWIMTDEVPCEKQTVFFLYETDQVMADFHAAGRHTHIARLLRSGVKLVEPRKLACHSDVRLTMRDYTDETLLPVAEQLGRVPSLKSSLNSSLNAGKTCPSVSSNGQAGGSVVAAESPENEESRAGLAGVVQEWPSQEKADREGFEPSVPL